MAAQVYRLAPQMRAWAARAKRNAREVILIGFQDMADQIKVEWPYLTGFSRASWFASVNALPQRAAGTADAGANYVVELAQFQLGDTLYFANTAVYSRRLELGFTGTDSLGRHYDQRGRFVVQGVVARAQEFFDAAAARVARGDAGGALGGGGGATPGVGITAG